METQDNPEDRESCVTIELGAETEPSLVRWSTWGHNSPWESYALNTTDGWVLIDPREPNAQAKERLHQLISNRPVATVLTSDGHERDCYMVRERWEVPVWGPEPGPPTARGIAYEGKPDHFYKAEQALPGGLSAIKIRGAWRGDHALLWASSAGHRFLFTGDVLNGQVEQTMAHLVQPDHYRYSPGLYFGARPNYVERHDDPRGLKQSLCDLLKEDFDAICGSHGMPFQDNPKTTLIQLLDTI